MRDGHSVEAGRVLRDGALLVRLGAFCGTGALGEAGRALWVLWRAWVSGLSAARPALLTQAPPGMMRVMAGQCSSTTAGHFLQCEIELLNGVASGRVWRS